MENTATTPSLGAKVMEFADGKVPNLTHTKMLSAQVNGKPLPPSATNWNRLLDEVILQAAAKLKDPKALAQLIIVNHFVGKKEDQGYRHLVKAGISVQGQDAEAAWKATVHILKSLGMSAEVAFLWYDNDKAAHPGQTGKLTVNSGGGNDHRVLHPRRLPGIALRSWRTDPVPGGQCTVRSTSDLSRLQRTPSPRSASWSWGDAREDFDELLGLGQIAALM